MDGSEALLIAGALVLVFGIIPLGLNSRFVKKYGETACSFSLMLFQVAGVIATVYFSGEVSMAFVVSVASTVLLYIVAFVISFSKAAILGAKDGDCILAGITQVLIPLGIAIIILQAMANNSGKKKRR